MVDVKISALGAIGTIVDADVIAIIDDVANTPVSKKATMAQVKTYIGTGMTASSTDTLTNKTFDVEGTGNSISNIDVADLKSGVLDTDISTTSASDDTIPSAKAVKTAIDAKASTVSELTDTTISSVGDNELLQYDSTSSKWINQTLAEAGISPVAGSSSITTIGTLGTLTVDNITINANTIEATNTNGNIILDSNGTGVIEVLGNTNDGAITLNCTSNSHGQTIKSQPHAQAQTNTMLLPKGASSTLVSLVSADTLTNKTLTSPQINTKLDILAQGELRLQDASGGQYIGFKAPTTVTDYTLTMPGTTGTQGQVLKMSSTSNTLEWGSAGGGLHEIQGFDLRTTSQINAHSPATGEDAHMYVKEIDTNNDGIFIKIKKNGTALTEVQIA